jgi:hypothetical protein
MILCKLCHQRGFHNSPASVSISYTAIKILQWKLSKIEAVSTGIFPIKLPLIEMETA